MKLAAFLRDAGADVCGVDLSGNPALGHWKSFEPALRLARHLKLPVTLHCGEIDGTGAEEAAMIAFAPERFGHCVQTSSDPERWLALRRSEIPIEICVSSNVVTDSVPYDENCDGGSMCRARRHHVGQVHAVGHPVNACAPTIPACLRRRSRASTPSCAVAFDLSDDDVRELVTASVRHAFMTDAHDDPFASTAMRVKRRVMRDAANWRGFPGGFETSARSANGWLTSRLMRRIRRWGRTLSTSLSRSNSPVPSPSAEIRYADDDDDGDGV